MLNKAIFTILIVMVILMTVASAQDRFNPPYPRMAMFDMTHFGAWPNYSPGTRIDMLEKYDMLILYAFSDNNDQVMAQEMRRRNPDQILLASGINGIWVNDPPNFMLHRSYRGTLLEDIEPGQPSFHVDTVEGADLGVYSADRVYLWIGDEIIRVTSIDKEENIFYVVSDTSYPGAVNEQHFAGDSVLSAIRDQGPGLYCTFSEYSPTLNGQRSWEYMAEKNIDREIPYYTGLYDGVFHDFFAYSLYIGHFTFDLDYNGVSDPEEHSNNWISNTWGYGRDLFVETELAEMQEAYPGGAHLLNLNTGSALTDYYNLCSGHMFEGFQRFSEWSYVKYDATTWINNHSGPNTNFIFDYFPENKFYNGKNRFTEVRFGLTTAMIFECYYARTAGDTYYLMFWYDEFETDMGYPVGDYYELSNGLVARNFTNGCVVCNPTGSPQILSASDLQGGPYYRFLGGQQPDWNNGELFNGTLELSGADYGPRNLRGDGILLFNEPTVCVNDIIIDNYFNNGTSPGQDSSAFQLVGNWRDLTARGFEDLTLCNPFYSQLANEMRNGYFNGAYGYNACYAGEGEKEAIWRPFIGVPGWYKVSEWHGWHGDLPGTVDEATNVPFEVVVSGEVKLRGIINQQLNYGQWNRLGYVYLPRGTDGYVKITNDANGTVIADAMNFHYMGTDYVPDTTPPASPQNIQVYTVD
jgi:hypothetical protein